MSNRNKNKGKQDESFHEYTDSGQSNHRNYKFITFQVSIDQIQERIKLIRMVFIDKFQIQDVIKVLGIKISTAKYILRMFRERKKILKKGHDKGKCQSAVQEQIRMLQKLYQQQGRSVRKRGRKLIKKKQRQDDNYPKVQEEKQKTLHDKEIDKVSTGAVKLEVLQITKRQEKNEEADLQNLSFCYPVWVPFLPVECAYKLYADYQSFN